jgi:hypothetical protein
MQAGRGGDDLGEPVGRRFRTARQRVGRSSPSDVREDRPPKPFIQTQFREQDASISPDGRCVAFTSDESGWNEIYVTSFPEPGRRVRVSADSGVSAQWRDDGTELFFESRGGSRARSAPRAQSRARATRSRAAIGARAGAARPRMRALIRLTVSGTRRAPLIRYRAHVSASILMLATFSRGAFAPDVGSVPPEVPVADGSTAPLNCTLCPTCGLSVATTPSSR